MTFTGGASGNETLYVDGLPNNAVLRTLAIQRPASMYLGAWFDTAAGLIKGDFAIGALRMHDGALQPSEGEAPRLGRGKSIE